MILPSRFFASKTSRGRRQTARRQRATQARRVMVEQLEPRHLLAAVAVFDFSDATGAASADGFVSSGPANQWHLSTGRGNDAGHSADDSFYFGSGEGAAGGGSYNNNANGSLLSPVINLPTSAVAQLTFSQFLQIEAGFDVATVSVVHSAGTTVLATSGGAFPNQTVGFESVSLDLTAFVGQSIQLAFRFTSNATTSGEGWYVDDVVVTTTGVNDWQPQGPFSATNGQVENVTPSDQIAGAIHTVLAHPTNADILYVGATNGGVWKTTNATAIRPNWVPLTDSLPSQSIGALAFDVADPTFNTIYAGVGRFSSFGRIGNSRVGVYKTTNGGQTWTVLNNNLVGANISGIVANGNNVVVSVNTSDSFSNSSFGVFRSTNGGNTFTQVSTGDGTATGLPGGVSYDLVADPINPNVLYTSTVFSGAVGGQNGIYRSSNGGANWVKVSNPAMDALILSGGGGGVATTSNLELAVGRFNNVYAAVINNGNLAGLFRSADGGATWILLDTPSTNENGIDVGLNPRGTKGPAPSANATPEEIAGGQGAIHFSIIADRDNPNLVYVAGDRQPRANGDQGGFPNSIGAFDFSGRVFRGDVSQPPGSQFVHLTHSNTLGAAGGGTASSSAPHADSRDMAIDANGNLIEVDDGGIYRRTSPQDNTGDWFGVHGNLQVTEAHNIAYDSLSNTITTGNQDTGTTYQTSPGAQTYISLSTADGGDVVIDNQSLAASNQSVRYSSFQNLGAFRQTVFDAAGNLVSQSFPALAGFNNDGAFVTPLAINAVDPTRLVIQGGSQTYETFDQAATVTGLGAAPNGGINQNAVAYGGRRTNVPNPNVLWVGSGSDVYVRTTAAGPLAFTASDPTGQTVIDLTINPDDWASAFVIDTNSVFATGNTGNSWSDITGNLLSFASSLQSIVYVATTSLDALVVGTNAGVFASLAGSFGTWIELGSNLPNVLTYDLDYDSGDDVLVAGTLGRGAWRLDNVSSQLRVFSGITNVSLDAGNNLIVTDTDGNFPDDITIQSDTLNSRFVISGSSQSFVTTIPLATGSGTGSLTIPFSAVLGPNLIFNTIGATDALTVDYSLGDFAKAIQYRGGVAAADSGNSLTLVGGPVFNNVVYNFTGAASGNVLVDSNAPIFYTNVEPIRSDLSATAATLNYNDAAQTISITPIGNNSNGLNIGSAVGESVSLRTLASSVTINAATVPGNDIHVIGAIDLAGTSLNVSGEDVTIEFATIVNSGTGSVAFTASRTLVLTNNSQITTVDGDVSLVANQTLTPAQGDLIGLVLDGATITTVTGDVSIQGRGGDEFGGNFNVGVFLINGSEVISTGSGAGVGAITITGRGGDGDNSNHGIAFLDTGTRVSSVDGDISLNGTGGTGTGGFNQGITIFQGLIESSGVGPNAATITLNGVGGAGLDSNVGVALQSIDTAITSVDGAIAITGQGNGTTSSNIGVDLLDGVQILSTGTGANAASIAIAGTGAAGLQSNIGIQLSGLAPQVTSIDGSIQLTGVGGNGFGFGGFNQGVLFQSGLVSSTGLGDVAVTGTGSGSFSPGISLDGGTILEATASGNLSLTGTGGTGFVVSDGIVVNTVDGATIGSATGTGTLTLTTDALNVDNVLTIQGAGELVVKALTLFTSIGVGGGFGTLDINDLELTKFADGFSQITIGESSGFSNVSVGTAVFTDPVTIIGLSADLGGLNAGPNTVRVIAEFGVISDSINSTDVAGSTVTLIGIVSPGGAPGTLTISGDVVLADNDVLQLQIGGIAPFIIPRHDQLDISGTITIGNNVVLQTARLTGFTPIVGNTFVIINNDGTDPVVGNFVGLPEGSTLNNFLGTNLTAVITYAGGSNNNDVVITVLPTVTLSVSPASIPENNGVATFTATLSASLGVPVTVDLGFSGSAQLVGDYTRSADQITILPGNLTGSITVTAVSDSTIEINENVIVQILSATNAIVPSLQQALTTIIEDDFLTPIIASVTASPTNLSTLSLTTNFNGIVNGFDQSDLQIVGGTISDFTDLGNGLFSFTVTPTSDGAVQVDIAAAVGQDTAGKNTLAATPFVIVIDRVGPTPVITGPVGPTKSNPFDVNIAFGESVSGFIASDITVVGGVVSSLSDNGNGNYTASVSAAIDGPVTVSILSNVTNDLAGNPNNAETATFSIVVDTRPPVPVITGPSGPINTDPFTVTIAFGETVSNFVVGDVVVVNGNVTSLIDNGNGNFTAIINATTDGIVRLNIAANVADDNAGNANLIALPYVVTVDTTAPTPSISGSALPSTTSTFDVTVDFNETVTGFVAGDITIVNGSVNSITDNGNGSFTASITAAADGNVTLSVAAGLATDAAGNDNLASNQFVIVVDTTDPTLTAPADIPVEGDTIGGALRTGAAITAFLAAAMATDTVDPSVTITNDAPTLFLVGTTLVTFTAIDDTGHTATATATVTVTDTAAPNLIAPPDVALEGNVAGGISAASQVIIDFLAAATATDIVDATLTITNNAPAIFPFGVTPVTFSVTDDAGNEATIIATVTVTDVAAPTITVPTNIAVEGDTIGGASRSGLVVAAFLAAATGTDIVDTSLTFTTDAPAVLPIGVTTITFTATDDAGNSASDTATITVRDTTRPNITAPADTTVEANIVGGATLDIPAILTFLAGAISSDIVDPNPIITTNAPTALVLGDTIVTFTSTDASGNAATASATVHVIDTTAPSLIAPANLVVNAVNGFGIASTSAAITSFLAAASANDLVDVNPIITSDAPAIFPLGDTLVTFTATDDSGNPRTATATVTVIALDFGDAPSAADSGFASSYPTTLAQNGARHIVGALLLGENVSLDADGQPSALADSDDDDGVVVLASLIATADVATTSSFTVTASGAGKLDAWIDFNQDGDWDDDGEQIFTSVDVVAGSNLLSFAIPAGAVAGSTAARFRLSSAGSLAPTGLAADGEVEDFLFAILTPSPFAAVSIDIPAGNVDVVVQGSDLIIRQDGVVLFQAPIDSFGELSFAGTSLDDILELSVLAALANQSLIFDGGLGRDIVKLIAAGETFDLTSSAITLREIEVIDITGTGRNTLVVSVDKVNEVTPTGDTLEIIADADDNVAFGDGFDVGDPQLVDGEFAHVLTEAAAGGTARVVLRNGRFYQNPVNRFDVDRDGRVRPLDALRIINTIRRLGEGASIPLTTSDGLITNLFVDVTGDNILSARDALQVVNAITRALRRSSPEGETSLPLVDLDQFTATDLATDDTSIDALLEHVVNLQRTLPSFAAIATTSDQIGAIDNIMRSLGDDESSDLDELELALLSDTRS